MDHAVKSIFYGFLFAAFLMFFGYFIVEELEKIREEKYVKLCAEAGNNRAKCAFEYLKNRQYEQL